jgi:hypothetical protein
MGEGMSGRRDGGRWIARRGREGGKVWQEGAGSEGDRRG